jgi:outer membrane biosynthesis protein TonB
MNEEQELAALEAELAALEAVAKGRTEEAAPAPEPEPEPTPVAEAPKPKKQKKAEPKAAEVKPPADPKAEAVRLYGAARLHAKRRAKGLR